METVKNEKLHTVKKNIGPHCPFIHSFSPGCYCTDMKSVRVEEAIYYCGGNYRKCNIYKSLTKKAGSEILESLQKEDLI